MKALLAAAHEVMRERSVPLSLLVPATDRLYGFYESCGYEMVFDRVGEPICLDGVLSLYRTDAKAAYTHFNEEYQQQDFCVLKTEEDFTAIMEEYALSGATPKYNLDGMAHIIDAEKLLQAYARANSSEAFFLKISGCGDIYKIGRGNVTPVKISATPVVEVDNRLLARLLFGYRLQELPPKYLQHFGEHHPIMNLMLE
jgi:predicted acetyltransferase